MRILFLGLNLPVPPTNGQAIRTLALVQALASRGHNLTFLSFVTADSSADLMPLSACYDVDLVPKRMRNMSAGSDYFRRLAVLLSRKAYGLERFRSAQMKARIQRHLAEDDFDLIVADSMYTLVNLPDTQIPIVLNCHNVEHLIVRRFADVEKNWAKRLYAICEGRWLHDAEAQACQRAVAGMVCSDADREVLKTLSPGLPLFVVPNTVDTSFYAPESDADIDIKDPVLLFQGSMDWHPNRDAVEFFVSAILPIVRKEFPAAKFVVAGRNPASSFVRKFEAVPNLEFTGTVPDMRPYLRAATVVVVPLRLGSGTRIKILEAGAAGKAVVSTRVGAEGLEFEQGKEILLADDPLEFADAVIQLLRDDRQRNELAWAARSKVVDRYSKPALERSVDEVMSSIGQEPAAAAAEVAGRSL